MHRLKHYYLLGLTSILFSCGGGEAGSGAFCDGDILIPFQEKLDDDWGFININGEVIIDPEFDFKPSFAVNGILLMKDDNKDGDKFFRYAKIQDGKAVESDEKWDLAGEFKEGLAPVVNKNERVKFINENYEEVFVVEAEKVTPFNEGMAAIANDDNKWGFINKEGKEVIDTKYDFVSNGFHDGYAIVGNITDDEKEFFIIDKSGNVKLDLGDKYQNVISLSSGLLKVIDDNEFGFIDLEGNIVIKPNDEWTNVTDFYNGFASFQEDNEWGLMNTQGETILKANYSNELLVVNDKIWVKDDEDWGVIDMEGNDIIEPQFDGYARPYPFMCATTIVQDGDDYLFIDSEGKAINQEEYENVAPVPMRLISGEPSNRIYESEYFDVSKVTSKVASNLLQIKTSGDFKSSFKLADSVLWTNNYGAKYNKVPGAEKWYFYVSGSNSYEFTAFQQLGEDAEKHSKYPMSAPNGIGSISYTVRFDDYMARTNEMGEGPANEFLTLSKEEQSFNFNPEAKVQSLELTVQLIDKAAGKASLVAEALAGPMKSSIKKIEEEKEDNSYSLKGELKGGEINITSSGSSTVRIKISYKNAE